MIGRRREPLGASPSEGHISLVRQDRPRETAMTNIRLRCLSTARRVAAHALVAFLAASAAFAQNAATAAAPQSSAGRPSRDTEPAGWVKEFGTMWTFDAPPLAYWRARYNFTPDQRWLDHVRLAAIRIPG